jgi:hypothetical protein
VSAEQSPLPATDDDMEVENDIDDDNLDIDYDDAEIDNDVDDDNLNGDHDDNAPLRFHSVNDILGAVGFAPHALAAEELHTVSSDESTSFSSVERSPSWRKAMMEEMTSIEENNTWSLIDLPHGRKPIGVNWMFKVKRDEHWVISKHKVRLVVKGYAQQYDIDYDEVFTLVA